MAALLAAIFLREEEERDACLAREKKARDLCLVLLLCSNRRGRRKKKIVALEFEHWGRKRGHPCTFTRKCRGRKKGKRLCSQPLRRPGKKKRREYDQFGGVDSLKGKGFRQERKLCITPLPADDH